MPPSSSGVVYRHRAADEQLDTREAGSDRFPSSGTIEDMGYAYVLWCNDRAAREMSDEELGESLVEVLGTNTYPSGGVEQREAGPFVLVKACYASSTSVFDVSEEGCSEVGKDRAFDGALGVVEVEPTGHRAVAAMREAMIRGRVPAFSQTEVNSAVSLLWFYADSLSFAPDPLEVVGSKVRSLLGTRRESVSVGGNYCNGLHRAFSLLPGGEAIGVWSGNRLCLADQLGEKERVALTSR